MSAPQQSTSIVYQNLVKMWGREPTWDEFKLASECGHVHVNKSIALYLINAKGGSQSYFFIYGFILPWIWILAIPVAVIAYFTGFIGGWSILGAFPISFIAHRIARDGQCEAAKVFAEKSQENYETAVRAGAFKF